MTMQNKYKERTPNQEQMNEAGQLGSGQGVLGLSIAHTRNISKFALLAGILLLALAPSGGVFPVSREAGYAFFLFGAITYAVYR